MERNRLLTKLLTLCILFLLAACGAEERHEHSHEGVTYTCPMHPQVVQDEMGTCPVCGMDLVPFKKGGKDQSLQLSENQQQLANVTTIAVGSGAIGNQTYLNARLALDPAHTHLISSRLAGRLEVLNVKETGVDVRKGQALYQLYSEDLLTLQQEYLLMEEQARKLRDGKRFEELAAAARQKLLLLGQTPAQVDQLKRSGKTAPYVTFVSPGAGTVAELMVTEGQYVDEGTLLMRLEGFDRLWVEADVYAQEAAGIQAGTMLHVFLAESGQDMIPMKVDFISPALGGGSQTLQIRGSIQNPGNLRPGMPVRVSLPAKAGSEQLSLPVDAVIREGNSQHVWIEVKEGVFEPRSVVTGDESANRVAVLEGLKEGERVVVTGAYLLYSEFILKKGAHPLAKQ